MRWYFLSHEICLLITNKLLFCVCGVFESKSWWKYNIYWLRKSSCFVFTGYWKILVLNFSVIRNTVFFWVKKLMERWYLLVTEKFLFWTFWWWEIRSFFQPKSWWKDDIYLVFLSFPWYSETWEIWFFVQWLLRSLQIKQ